MAKLRFHKVAAVAVLIGFAAWMGTGKFSSVGSASTEAGQSSGEEAKPAPAAEAAPKAPRTVAVVVPPRVQHERAIHLSGQTQADKRAVLATRAAGIIEKLPVKQGDKVEAGQVILALSAEDKPAMIDTAKQLVKQRQAELEAAQRLAKTGTLAKLSLDTAVSALAQAESQLKAAEADLERLTIVAPFAGVIDSVDVEIGSAVSQGAQIATLLSLDPVVVKGEVSERDLVYIKAGDKAEAQLVDGEKVAGTVRYISREATAATRTFRVEVAIPNLDDRIPAGMTAEITVRAAPADAVILPRSVVTLSADGDLGIRVADKDNKIVFYPIDLMDDLTHGLVLGGVPRDARVVVAGQDLVTEGDVVNPVPADEQLIRKLVGDVTASN
ncbi:MAG: efflux RND transporter periplasmic adaptor subunit [Mesorhizobium sp.]|nr:efflux RND transporter periplasmic adaptor subunit [Mesorhizobium sp.]MCO5161632.1 efflux RND transporter periplasmic adaptor subunit [Mesorhizobium sp.]